MPQRGAHHLHRGSPFGKGLIQRAVRQRGIARCGCEQRLVKIKRRTFSDAGNRIFFRHALGGADVKRQFLHFLADLQAVFAKPRGHEGNCAAIRRNTAFLQHAPKARFQFGAGFGVAGDHCRCVIGAFKRRAQTLIPRKRTPFQQHQPRARTGQRSLGGIRQTIRGIAHPHQASPAGQSGLRCLTGQQPGIAACGFARHIHQAKRIIAHHGAHQLIRPFAHQPQIIAINQHNLCGCRRIGQKASNAPCINLGHGQAGAAPCAAPRKCMASLSRICCANCSINWRSMVSRATSAAKNWFSGMS